METDIATSGIVTWIANNPFGEPSAYLLVHPKEEIDADGFLSMAEHMGFKRLDGEGDITWVGTETLLAALRARQVEFWAGERLWMRHPVTDDWTGAAIARRYVVLAIGTTALPDDPDDEDIAAYLAERTSVYPGLVKIRLKVTEG